MHARTVLAVALAAAALGCGGSKGGSGRNGQTLGGAVSGPADTHCALGDGGLRVQAINPASCSATGAGGDDGGDMPATLYNADGYDDDCKLHIAWSASPIQQGTDVEFTLTLTALSDGQPLTGAPIYVESMLGDTHPGPNTSQTSMEMSPGVYHVGPVRFDAAGQWTVRFHFNGNCSDALPDSPHAHAAFFVEVP